jgi:hypothetical protein
MRILEQTKDVLTLQNPARDFWFGNLFLFFGSPPIMVVLAISKTGWKFLYLPIIAGGFCLALKQIWASDVVKVCRFNKSLRKITIEYHGLQTKTKDFPLQDVQAEVIKSTRLTYGAGLKSLELWLVDKKSFANIIALSEVCHHKASKASLEAIVNQIREFLRLSDRSM